MPRFFVGPSVAMAIAGTLVLGSPAFAKTVKECRAEWSANKAANQAKGITEKAYVDQCRAADQKPKAAKEEKAKPAAKEKAAAKPAATAKTVKQCEAEWRANKAANQAKGITEKAYVADCRSGKAAATPAAPAPKQITTAPPKAEPRREAAPAQQSKPMAPVTAAPPSGEPQGVNQFAAEGQAKAHCPRGLVVWANLESKIYHFAGHKDYGHTKQGAYMCETDAEAQGMRAAKNEKRP